MNYVNQKQLFNDFFGDMFDDPFLTEDTLLRPS